MILSSSSSSPLHRWLLIPTAISLVSRTAQPTPLTLVGITEWNQFIRAQHAAAVVQQPNGRQDFYSFGGLVSAPSSQSDDANAGAGITDTNELWKFDAAKNQWIHQQIHGEIPRKQMILCIDSHCL